MEEEEGWARTPAGWRRGGRTGGAAARGGEGAEGWAAGEGAAGGGPGGCRSCRAVLREWGRGEGGRAGRRRGLLRGGVFEVGSAALGLLIVSRQLRSEWGFGPEGGRHLAAGRRCQGSTFISGGNFPLGCLLGVGGGWDLPIC